MTTNLNELPAFVNYEGYDLEQGLESVGPGWADLIRIAFALKPDDVRIVQVKEKFAHLRIYTNSLKNEDFNKVLNLLDRLSGITCEDCGKKGTLDNRYPYIRTLCTQCKRRRARLKKSMDAARAAVVASKDK